MGAQKSNKKEKMSIERKYRKGEILFREGEPPREIFLIKEGKVEIIKGDKRLAILDAGEFLGEMAVLDGRPRSATARALEDTVVLTLDRDELLKKMEDDPMLGALITTLIRRLREADRRLAER
ncbi:hypothetical protein DRQ16_04150 [bacterium]|nr:MAG: hypothetical protein DRQ16_04150 [bacterium]RKZ21978.1 MAG: hypothetical protein DRQ18_03510 [bacterium]RKZ26009.1 MAG: hypothetical protein DRQ20_03930 [bacterium]